MSRQHQVTGLQETYVRESDVARLCNQVREAGFVLTFGEPTNITKDETTRYGRRVAILSALPAIPVDITDDKNPTCALLLSSGRWVEGVIPTGNGTGYMIVACLYGYPGASQNKRDHNYRDAKTKNEAFLAACAVRTDQFPNVPYYLTTDLNDDPANSDTACRCIESELFCDLPADWHVHGELPRTFFRAWHLRRNARKGRHSH